MGNTAMSGEEAYAINKSQENRLGEGSYAEVYKITHREEKKIYAGKFLKFSPDKMDQLQNKGYEEELFLL